MSGGEIPLTIVVEILHLRNCLSGCLYPYGCLLAGSLGSDEVAEAVKDCVCFPLPGAGLRSGRIFNHVTHFS